MPLQNFGVVDSYPGNSPALCRHIFRAAQPDREAFESVHQITEPCFVSYRLSDSDEGDISLEQETAIAADVTAMRVIHDPRLGNGMRPTVEALKAVAADVDAIYKGGETVLIHCLHGRERTGAVCAAWRLIYGGATIADIEADLKAYGVSGLTALVDHEIVEAVREIARGVADASADGRPDAGSIPEALR